MRSKFLVMLEVGLLSFLGLAFILLSGHSVQAAPWTGEVFSPDEDGLTGRAAISETVLTLNISNEPPGKLIDALIAQGHGNQTLFQVLGYLKAQSSGVIPEAFYTSVENAPAGSEVFTAQLSNYAALQGAVEISADGTVHIRGLQASSYSGKAGYSTVSGQDGRFTLTSAQEVAHYIYTGSESKQVGPDTYTYNYYCFAIAWSEGYKVFMPLVARNMISPFADDFSNANSGWYTGAGDGWSINYLNGEYQILASANDTYAWGAPDRVLPADYRMEVDARLVGNNAGAYSLLFGTDYDVTTGYAFTVFPKDRTYALTRLDGNDSWTNLVYRNHPVIRADTAVNRLRVDRIGASIHAYVNDVLVAAYVDDTYLGAELYFALMAESFTQGAVDARFDNFSVKHTRLSNPLYVDDFSATDRWFISDPGWGRFSYQSGEYEILIRNTNSWGFANSPIGGGLTRYAIEVDARISAGTIGLYGMNFGLVDGNHFYHFRVYPATHQYALFKFSGSTWTNLTGWQSNPAIHDETGINHLKVERDGEQIRLYVNDTLLTSLSDATYLGILEVSLFGWSWTEPNVAMRFDNFTFSELP